MEYSIQGASKMISVIIPTYNSYRYIDSMICCLEHQTFKNYEAIIVDDGSTDMTKNKYGGFISEKIRFIFSSHQGQQNSRYIGFLQSKGEYIAFIDVDDFIEPTYLEKLYLSIINNGSDISICNHTKLQKDKKIINTFFDQDCVLSKEEALAHLFSDSYITSYQPTKLFKREIIEGIDFGSNIVLEDMYVMDQFFSKADKVSIVCESLYVYNQNNINSICAQKKVQEILVAYSQVQIHRYKLWKHNKLFKNILSKRVFDSYKKMLYLHVIPPVRIRLKTTLICISFLIKKPKNFIHVFFPRFSISLLLKK